MMSEIQHGRVTANGLSFEFLEAGEGPLALCMHGFPDSPFTYRYLLPKLAEAGFRAVAPFQRGYSPTELPSLRSRVHSSVLVEDQLALADALGGGHDSVLVAHDWGALAAWGALRRGENLWGRAVVLNIPPYEIFAETLFTYPQLKKSFYFWFFQMRHVIEDRVRQNDFEFIRDLWADWSPGYVADEDLVHLREALSEPNNLRTALSYYFSQFDPSQLGSAEWAEEQEAAWGGRATQPVLYLHGTNDGCYGVTEEQMTRIPSYGGAGSVAEMVEGVGHFMLVERPEEVNSRILRWLTEKH